MCNLKITVILTLCLIHLAATYIGVAIPDYRYPFDPIFILYGLFGTYRLIFSFKSESGKPSPV